MLNQMKMRMAAALEASRAWLRIPNPSPKYIIASAAGDPDLRCIPQATSPRLAKQPGPNTDINRLTPPLVARIQARAGKLERIGIPFSANRMDVTITAALSDKNTAMFNGRAGNISSIFVGTGCRRSLERGSCKSRPGACDRLCWALRSWKGLLEPAFCEAPIRGLLVDSPLLNTRRRKEGKSQASSPV